MVAGAPAIRRQQDARLALPRASRYLPPFFPPFFGFLPPLGPLSGNRYAPHRDRLPGVFVAPGAAPARRQGFRRRPGVAWTAPCRTGSVSWHRAGRRGRAAWGRGAVRPGVAAHPLPRIRAAARAASFLANLLSNKAWRVAGRSGCARAGRVEGAGRHGGPGRVKRLRPKVTRRPGGERPAGGDAMRHRSEPKPPGGMTPPRGSRQGRGVLGESLAPQAIARAGRIRRLRPPVAPVTPRAPRPRRRAEPVRSKRWQAQADRRTAPQSPSLVVPSGRRPPPPE